MRVENISRGVAAGSEVLTRMVRSHTRPGVAGSIGDVGEGPGGTTIGGQVNTLVVHRHSESIARSIRCDGGMSSGGTSGRPSDAVVIRYVDEAIL